MTKARRVCIAKNRIALAPRPAHYSAMLSRVCSAAVNGIEIFLAEAKSGYLPNLMVCSWLRLVNKNPIRTPLFGALVVLLGLLLVWVILRYPTSTKETLSAVGASAVLEAETKNSFRRDESFAFAEPAISNVIISNNTSLPVISFRPETSLDTPNPSPLLTGLSQPVHAESHATNSPTSLPDPFTNSLGMRFVVVPGAKVLFSVWDTRVQDYQTFAAETRRDWPKPKWKTPGFQQDPTHPAVMVSWYDAQTFCAWLTQKDRQDGQFGSGISYRLPTDVEWSAAGCDGDNLFPWGNQWPPPWNAGNYNQKLSIDGYPHTSPVGSFSPNKNGLYDMGGNVAQWCDILRDPRGDRPIDRPVRGGAWTSLEPFSMVCSFSPHSVTAARTEAFGFRVVLAINAQ